MAKAEIHPTWYPDAKVICNGEVVMTTGSTQPELHVDVWSGNHPFYTGTQKILDTEGRVDRFMRKYGMGSADSATAGQEKAKSAQAAPKAEPTAKAEAAAAVPAAKAAEGA
ncbi:MAG: 50S ribosomal protein L31 [Cyanobium sp.]